MHLQEQFKPLKSFKREPIERAQENQTNNTKCVIIVKTTTVDSKQIKIKSLPKNNSIKNTWKRLSITKEKKKDKKNA